MYPEGGYANDCCIQRGSIITLPYQGDPLTPGIAATEDAKRLDPATLDLPKIPVQPIGWAAAKEIMSRMTGSPVPEGWQGGLPFTYRVMGGEGLTVHLKVEQKREVRKTANVIATLKGSVYPEEKMIIGAHHDAWNCGASDPLCGTIAMIESAKSFAQMAAEGHRPERSIVFAAWGAEEFGIMGSTEWVEANRRGPDEERGGVYQPGHGVDGAGVQLERFADAAGGDCRGGGDGGAAGEGGGGQAADAGEDDH